MNCLIAYYSWKGHTKEVATTLAKELSAEMNFIEPARPIHIVSEAFKAFFSMKSPIKPMKTEISDYDVLIIASPVWCGKVPPYVNEYLDSIDGGAGKPFYVIVEMGGRGADSAIAVIRKRLEKKGMIFKSSVYTIEKNVESGEFKEKASTFARAIQAEN
ncbi:MAG: NAD(P)H-dependent oxidoreductase [Methanospirillaceae archaeon]|nr:NAD(P)H-dependent oxidoreductase [Methanospirillaceae archaeon]